MNNNDLQSEANLIKLSFQNMYLQKGKDKEPHRELHAANLLEPDKEWCTRRYVLMNLFPQEVQKPELKSWDWKREAIFEDGWVRHRKIQALFKKYANVAWSENLELELDLTHYLEEENIYFSPDAILNFGNPPYLVEIKGLKQEEFVLLTDDLMQAITVSDVVRKARIQANNYLFLAKLQKAILWIENKNKPQDFMIYVMNRDLKLYEPYRLRISEVRWRTAKVKLIGMSELSPRVCQSPDDKLAQQCPMRNVCFSKKVEEVKE